MSRDDPRGRVPVRPPAVRRERRASLSSLVRRGAPLEHKLYSQTVPPASPDRTPLQ